MKRKTIILMLVIVILPCLILAETADIRINNPRVEGGYYKFDLQIRRTGDWAHGLGSAGMLGQADWYFNFNTAAFGANSPTCENLNSTIITMNGTGGADYTFTVQINGGRLQVKCVLESTADEGYGPPLNTWANLLTVTWLFDDAGQNSGVTWDQVNTGLQDGDNEAITETYYGNGDISLSVIVEGVAEVPIAFGLSQNYPNPFNPETILDYQIVERNEVLIAIYNLIGHRVKTIVKETQNPGYYTARWDGKDERGLQVSGGIYFARIRSGEFSDVKKMILLK